MDENKEIEELGTRKQILKTRSKERLKDCEDFVAIIKENEKINKFMVKVVNIETIETPF